MILFSIDINECLSQPCQNGGTCSDDINGYICTCLNGFAGANCDFGNWKTNSIMLQFTPSFTLKWLLSSIN